MPVTRGQQKRLHVQSTIRPTPSVSDTSTRTKDKDETSTKRPKQAKQQLSRNRDRSSVKGQVHRLVRPTDDTFDSTVHYITTHNDELFVINWPNGDYIEVYGMSDFTYRRDVHVDGFSGVAVGLTACDTNNCLYVAGCHGSIHRVEIASGSYDNITWKLNYRLSGPSVNRQHNLLVVGNGIPQKQDAILEYTTHGQLVREILLNADNTRSWYVLQLNDNQFLVGQTYRGSSRGRVCVVDPHGVVIITYEPGQGQFARLGKSVIDRNGFICTVEYDKKKIVVLTSELNWSRDIKLDGILNFPSNLCWLNDSRDRLLVVEHSLKRRIAVIDL